MASTIRTPLMTFKKLENKKVEKIRQIECLNIRAKKLSKIEYLPWQW